MSRRGTRRRLFPSDFLDISLPEVKVVETTDEVRRERRAWRRSYYVDVCRRWEAGKINHETYWLYGADSDCSVFDEPL